MVDITELLGVLPHRYPMLLVDRILEINEEGTQCTGLKNVTMNEPFFQGHYPGKPIMPGVLIIESMAQVGAALLMKYPTLAGRIPLIGGIDGVKFRRMVQPGDQLIINIEILWVKGNVGKMLASASVDGDLAAKMEMVFKLADPNQSAE